MKNIILTLLVLVSMILIPSNIFAKLGVGVGTGKIVVDQKLRSGTIYKLPPITVLNTGDEKATYSVSVAYHEKQPEIMPSKSWFTFSPEKFDLESGEAQSVDIKLNLPLRTTPGKYFAYLEASPTKSVVSGEAKVGIAAATKLYFEIIPSNIFEAIYFKILSFYQVYAPWPQRVTVSFGIIVAILLGKKFLNINISFKNKKNVEKKS